MGHGDVNEWVFIGNLYEITILLTVYKDILSFYNKINMGRDCLRFLYVNEEFV